MPDIKRLTLRLPDDLHEKLVAWARNDERSLHNLIVRILRDALKERSA